MFLMIFVSSFTRADNVPIICVGDDAATLKTKQTTSYSHKVKIKKVYIEQYTTQ
jgi:hypothetical protein